MSKPLYFDYGFIPSRFIRYKLSLDDITPQMVYQFINRENEDVIDYSPTTEVIFTQVIRETVLESMDAIKTFFRLKALDFTAARLIQLYNKKYIEPGRRIFEATTVLDLVEREDDFRKVSEQQARNTLLLVACVD